MFWKQHQKFAVGSFKNICTVVVHCWYIKDAFAGFCQQVYTLYLSTGVPSQKLKYNIEQACIFSLILISIPSSLILSVKIRGMKGFLLNDQNLLSMMKVICWGSLSGWLLSLEFKVYLKKFIPSPEMQKVHVIPGYNLSWYTEQPS